MADDKIKLMEELCMTPGISSHEEKIAEIIKRELKETTWEMYSLLKRVLLKKDLL